MNFQRETMDLWTRLQGETRPVVLYGMGNGAEKILAQCREHGIPVRDIFASDEYVRGHEFAGFRVKKYAEICEQYPDCVILLAFAAFQPELLEKIYTIAERYEVLAPDVPLFGEGIFTAESVAEHGEKLTELYEILADERSRQVLEGLIAYKISGKISYLKEIETPREEIFENIFTFSAEETFVDLGAYNGDTVEEFLQETDGKFRRILAVEPDVKNFKKLQEKVAGWGKSGIELYPCGAWQEDGELQFSGGGGRNSCLTEGNDRKSYRVPVRSVDSLLDGAEATYVKMDVEGAEREALFGCRRTIRAFAPKLAVSAYHRTNDFFTLALLIHHLNPEYRIFLRHHPYIPAWETNLYAVKGEI